MSQTLSTQQSHLLLVKWSTKFCSYTACMHLSTIPMTDGHPGAARTFPKIESSLIAPSPQAAASIIGWFSLAPSLPYVEPKSASVNSIGPSSALWSSTAQFCSHTTINPLETTIRSSPHPLFWKHSFPHTPSLDMISILSTMFASFSKSGCCCSVAKSSSTLCDLMDCSTPGFPVFNYLLEFAQTHVHLVRDIIQPSHPLLPSSPSALNLSQHQDLFERVGSSHQVAKVLELQQHSFQWIFRVDFL